MNIETSPRLIAIVGGSGSGKSWLAKNLCSELEGRATTLSLDDFYADLSHLMLSERERINFDHPDAIDWALFEEVLRDLRNGEKVTVPRYDFATHNRLPFGEVESPRPIVIVEGLWLLWPAQIRELFDLRIFLDCPESLRWQRRLQRDLEVRHRTADSICDCFWNVVAPMHERFVESQKAWADIVVEQPTSEKDFEKLLSAVHALSESELAAAGTTHLPNIMPGVPAIQTL